MKAGQDDMTGRILTELSRADAYPHEAEGVRVVQTHISMVFLAGRYAYKVKKPVSLGFLDFGTLALRRRFCHEEVRLNRRLAPSVYHGVVPIVRSPDGLRVLDRMDPFDGADARDDTAGTNRPIESNRESEEADSVVEWAVRMDRLPEDRTLKALLRREEVGKGVLERLARLLASFHAEAERGPSIAAFGEYPAVFRNASDNFDELEAAVGSTLSRAVLLRLEAGSKVHLSRLRPLIERRAREGRPCDTHGDLRLGHVYALREAGADDRIVVVDCIEFSDRFRYADPVADIAFLVMELDFEDRPDLARAFADRYLKEARDPEGADLLPWYASYRDVVRGKVRTLESVDEAVRPEDRERAARRATRHFLRALGRLEPASERPVLVLLSGLPGSGKSVLARGLAEVGGFTWIDTDRVRKRLAETGEGPASAHGRRSPGASDDLEGPAFEGGIYTRAWTDRTYGACLEEAQRMLFEGGRVLVEGSFRAERHRALFLEAARTLGVPALLLHCEVDREVARLRLAARRGDVSDADWRVFEEAERRWEAPGRESAAAHRAVQADGPPPEVLRAAQDVLEKEGFL